MKNIKKYVIVAIIVIILIIIALVMSMSAGTKPPVTQIPGIEQILSNTTSTTSQPAVKAPTPVKTAPAPKTSSNPGATFVPTGNYTDYQNQLATNQNACKSLATAQYDKLYGQNLESSSFQSYYNPKSNICFMQATGNMRAAYATTTSGHIYLRNASQNALIAECVDPTGTRNGNVWSCTNKVSGKSISKAEYDAQLYAYIAQ